MMTNQQIPRLGSHLGLSRCVWWKQEERQNRGEERREQGGGREAVTGREGTSDGGTQQLLKAVKGYKVHPFPQHQKGLHPH